VLLVHQNCFWVHQKVLLVHQNCLLVHQLIN
jgi:hypothetical protein